MLNFADLRIANYERCEKVFHGISEWSPTDWATAFAGECGEACNLIKKWRRSDYGHDISPDDIADEIADTVIYADLLCSRIGVSLEDAIVRKFNEVSRRRKCSIKLPAPPEPKEPDDE